MRIRRQDGEGEGFAFQYYLGGLKITIQKLRAELDWIGV